MKCGKFFILILFAAFLLYSCKKSDGELYTSTQTSSRNERVKVGLALGYGGMGDMSFNDMQYAGLIRASKKYDIDIAYAIPKEEKVEDIKINLAELIYNEKCSLIFMASYIALEILPEIAPIHPDIHFVILDNPLNGIDNVSSVEFAQNEGSFVVGYLAARFSKSLTIGFIGGTNEPVILDFLKGFEEGVGYADRTKKIDARFASLMPDFSGYHNPKLGYEIATEMYKSSVDVIYNVASLTGGGIIQAAVDNGAYVIGVDSDQDGIAKGSVLTSMMKRLDNCVVDLVGYYLDGTIKGNFIYRYDYRNNGVGITDMIWTKDVIGEKIISDTKEIEKKIARGEIVVTDSLKKESK